jgi:hypothetical protein
VLVFAPCGTLGADADEVDLTLADDRLFNESESGRWASTEE